MLTSLIILTVFGGVAFLVFREKDEGREVSREELAAEISKFIDGSATARDWDNFTTFSLKDAELEAIRRECVDALLEIKTKQEKPWLSDQAVATLTSAVACLRKAPSKLPDSMAGQSLDTAHH
jgi:hypothetical protein